MTVATADEIKLLFLEFQSAGVTFHQRLKKQPWGAKNSLSKIRMGICCCLLEPRTDSHQPKVMIATVWSANRKLSRNGLGGD
jgi:hypothetical protein